MSNLNIMQVWLEQDDVPPMGQALPPQGNEPVNEPQTNDDAADFGFSANDEKEPEAEADISTDPQQPDAEENNEEQDFEVWKRQYFKLAIKGDPNEMLDAINQVRDRDLEPVQRKFVEDNLQIIYLRQDATVEKASNEVRKLISQEIDNTNPGTTMLKHLNTTLASYQTLSNVFIKLIGTYGQKADLYRKFIAGLFGCVQVGGGGQKEDLIYSASEYSVNISTRFYTMFGDISLGQWNIKEDDAEKYLAEPELERLQNGSPEEKRVLRRRIVIESIVSKFEDRSFIIHVSDPSTGTINSVAWDLSGSLKSGYNEGKFIVRKKTGITNDAMIDDNGSIIPLFDLSILYLRDTTEVDDRGQTIKVEEPFLEKRDNMLYLVASKEIMKDAGTGMPGIIFNEVAYQGNPSDIKKLIRCVPSIVEVLLRRCE